MLEHPPSNFSARSAITTAVLPGVVLDGHLLMQARLQVQPTSMLPTEARVAGQTAQATAVLEERACFLEAGVQVVAPPAMATAPELAAGVVTA